MIARVRTSARRVVRAALAAVLVAVAPVVAFAHGGLKSSVPANRARLAVAPRELRLTFTEAPELAVTTIRLRGPDSADVALEPLRRAPDSRQTVVTAVRGALTAGTYAVRWQTAGADGHPTSGAFTFTIEVGAQGIAAPAGVPGGATTADSATPLGSTPSGSLGPARPSAVHHDTTAFPAGEGFDAESPAYVVIRWLQFGALLTLIGAIAFRFVVLRFLNARSAATASLTGPASDRAARVAVWAGAALAVVALLRLYAQSVAMHGGAGALAVGPMLGMVGGTTWGRGWLLQVIGCGLALAGLLSVRRGREGGWTLSALGVLALAVAPALSGHAASAPNTPALAMAADAAHVIGAGSWLGSLLFVIAVGVPTALGLAEPERGPAVADLVNAFSPTALVFAGVTAATGVFAAWIHLGSVSALWHTRYGQLLLLKLGAVSVLAATGAYNWLRVRPSLGRPEGATRVRRSATVELAVGVIVLAVTAVLVATPTALDLSAMRTASGR